MTIPTKGRNGPPNISFEQKQTKWDFHFQFWLGWFSIINNLIIILCIIIYLINIIIISTRQSTINFDSLCSGPRSRTCLNQKNKYFLRQTISERISVDVKITSFSEFSAAAVTSKNGGGSVSRNRRTLFLGK